MHSAFPDSRFRTVFPKGVTLLPDFTLHNLLLLSADPAFLDRFLAQTADTPFAQVPCTFAGSCAQARSLLADQHFSLCIAEAPLADALGLEFCREFLGKRIGEESLLQSLRPRALAAGIGLLPLPCGRLDMLCALSCVEASQRSLAALRQENADLLRRMDTLRTIDRAKYLLMQYLGMSEAQAHRYIERQAMNLRVSKKIIAEHIRKTYDN